MRLRADGTAIGEALELAEGFASLVRCRRPTGLVGWLERAEGGAVAELRSFASRLRQDEAAVRAGLELEWRNGQTEGQVNRLKLVKRSMYGRAGFNLLRARVLSAG
jgi:transposase